MKYWRLVICSVWCLVTLASLIGMYHLWWTREWRLYGDTSPAQQRREVFLRAGIPESLVDEVDTIQTMLPEDARYRARGDHNHLSYVTYLLIPRIPSGGDITLQEKDGSLSLRPPLSSKALDLPVHPPRMLSLLGSVLFVFGFAYGLKRLPPFREILYIESIGMSCGFLMMMVLISRTVCYSALPAFRIFACLGILGWIYGSISRKTGLKIRLPLMSAVKGNQGLKSNPVSSIWIQTIMLSCLFLIILWSVAMSVIVVPDDWDAWAIWGPKAKVLALGSGSLADVTFFGHADYPLLWPSVWAFSGWCGGGWEEHFSRVWGSVFLVLIAVYSGRETWRRSSNILFACGVPLAFLSMPMVPLLASWSYAEAPLWFFCILGIGRLLRWSESGSSRDLLYASILLTCSAYTKNEGLMWFAFSAAWTVWYAPKSIKQTFIYLVLPFIICYSPWLIWSRFVLGLGSHATGGFAGGIENLHRVGARVLPALRSMARMWSDPRQWNIVLWILLVLFLLNIPSKIRNRSPLCIPLAMAIVLLAVNVFHQVEIGLMMSSWNRMTVQFLGPAILILSTEIQFLQRTNNVKANLIYSYEKEK